MAQISHVLARLKRDPVADLPMAPHLEQLLHDQGHALPRECTGEGTGFSV